MFIVKMVYDSMGWVLVLICKLCILTDKRFNFSIKSYRFLKFKIVNTKHTIALSNMTFSLYSLFQWATKYPKPFLWEAWNFSWHSITISISHQHTFFHIHPVNLTIKFPPIIIVSSEWSYCCFPQKWIFYKYIYPFGIFQSSTTNIHDSLPPF